MSFNYSETGLPDNSKMKMALAFCHRWLMATPMAKQFGPARIDAFVKNQPVHAAKLIMNECPDYSEASIVVALLGPAKSVFMDPKQGDAMARQMFGDGVADLIAAIAGQQEPSKKVDRDMVRIFMVEGLSTMKDQLIDRKNIDAHHAVRWDILEDFEKKFKLIEGLNPSMDKLFVESLKKSRTAMEALGGREAVAKKRMPTVKRKGPKPPSM